MNRLSEGCLQLTGSCDAVYAMPTGALSNRLLRRRAMPAVLQDLASGPVHALE